MTAAEGTIRDRLTAGDDALRAGDAGRAVACYLDAAGATEVPRGDVCVRLARAHLDTDPTAALGWALRVCDAGDDVAAWDAASKLLARLDGVSAATTSHRLRVAVVGSSTTTYLARFLRLVTRRRGVHLDCIEGGYGQYAQELLDAGSAVHAFGPDAVVLAVHERDVALPELAAGPGDAHDAVEAELARWQVLWDAAGAPVVQPTFVLPPDPPLGHLAATVAAGRQRMLARLNERIADTLPPGSALLDLERLAGAFGKHRWLDPVTWNRAKIVPALGALPLLARHTAAKLAPLCGVVRKVLVCDLDNTLWGGVIGEDGLDGIRLGEGDVAGEAFVALQGVVAALGRRGVVLAVCSKNDPDLAASAFTDHKEMRLRLGDFASFRANWTPKSENLVEIAAELDLGLDSFVYLDDNPVERQEIRRFVPEVDVLVLPDDPALYARTLAAYPFFETGSFTAEDARRGEQYRARAEVRALERSAASIEEFYLDLHMQATVEPFDAQDLSRIAQLVGKTNQFNLTTRRHSADALRRFMEDPGCVHLSLRLRDRFADHGLVGAFVGVASGDVLDIDTFLMSCRVIGRTAEQSVVAVAAGAARARGFRTLRGTYVPTGKNELVRDLYERLGFEPAGTGGDTTTWSLDLAVLPEPSPFIEIVDRGGRA